MNGLLTRLTRRKASVGLFFGTPMPAEPAVKRTIAFVKNGVSSEWHVL
jgi:hypothetical protein